MPAFSRGIFLLRLQVNCSKATTKQLHHIFFIPNSAHPSSHQQFSTSTLLRAVKRAQSKTPQHVLPSKSTSKPTPSTSTTTSKPKPSVLTYQSFAANLAQKANPTLLYQAPSHTLFMISSYSAATFFFSYAGISFYSNYLHPPPGLATWVPIAFAGICFMMGAFGGWMMLGPAGIIKSITAIPQRALTSTPQPELKIEVELRKMLPIPFFPSRKLLVKPEDIVFDHRLSATASSGTASTPASAAELRSRRLQAEEEQRRRQEYERTHILTAPFRHASMAFYSVFRSLRQTWTREGFAKVRVQGRTYKLDVVDGWALDEGRALDRLVQVRPRAPVL
ncbi:hypothetical protein F5884DRAFT_665298 [Xylogone sp. PMI_703]|nr:hypothetical protein F5884DRAFT_665298 [Xylogone sp. PMI_703]